MDFLKSLCHEASEVEVEVGPFFRLMDWPRWFLWRFFLVMVDLVEVGFALNADAGTVVRGIAGSGSWSLVGNVKRGVGVVGVVYSAWPVAGFVLLWSWRR